MLLNRGMCVYKTLFIIHMSAKHCLIDECRKPNTLTSRQLYGGGGKCGQQGIHPQFLVTAISLVTKHKKISLLQFI